MHMRKPAFLLKYLDLNAAPDPLFPTHLDAQKLLLVSLHPKALVFVPEMSPGMA